MVRSEAQDEGEIRARIDSGTGWLTPADIAKRLRCSEERARALIRSQMKFVQLGRRGIRVSALEFARFEGLHWTQNETPRHEAPTVQAPLPPVTLRPVAPRRTRTASHTPSRTS